RWNPARATRGELGGHEEAGQEPQAHADVSGPAEEAQRAVVSQQREDRAQNAEADAYHADFGMAAARPGLESDGYLDGAKLALQRQDAELGLQFEPGRQDRRMLDEFPGHGTVAGAQVGHGGG